MGIICAHLRLPSTGQVYTALMLENLKREKICPCLIGRPLVFGQCERFLLISADDLSLAASKFLPASCPAVVLGILCIHNGRVCTLAPGVLPSPARSLLNISACHETSYWTTSTRYIVCTSWL